MAFPVSKQQAQTLVPIITRFIGACNMEQIRLAPEKCNVPIFVLRNVFFKVLNMGPQLQLRP